MSALLLQDSLVVMVVKNSTMLSAATSETKPISQQNYICFS